MRIPHDTVNESKRKPHNISNDSESIQVNNSIDTGTLNKPTSKKAKIERAVVVKTDKHVINWAPLTPTFLPKNPETIEPSKGNIIMAKYII